MIFADDEPVVAFETIGRHGKIIGRRHALVDATGEIVFRAVAGTEISFVAIDDGLGLVVRDTAEMRADADKDEIFRLDGP